MEGESNRNPIEAFVFERGIPLTSENFQKFEAILNGILDHSILDRLKSVSVYSALAGFVTTIALVFLKKNGILNSEVFPGHYFNAIYVAFSFILFYEILSIVFALPESIARSIGRQYQVMSLVLIRHVFEMAGHYHNITDLVKDQKAILSLATAILGSMLVFFLIGLYRGLQKHRTIVQNEDDLHEFVLIKKAIGCMTIVIFLIMGSMEFSGLISDIAQNKSPGGRFGFHFYSDFFSVMIFIDILLVLLSMNYGETYHVVFRNTGLMISTVLLRISFTESIYVWTLLTTGAVLIGVIATLIYNYYLEIEDQLKDVVIKEQYTTEKKIHPAGKKVKA